ncbi:DUF3105 domain-containing protein [Kribbella sp. HUAS MG21]|uniref:DUF3105 domain-containing protein n=1 Tax=Kribbella sp. HUAS MG21 TaxID=3160966 RepID=A0AAU7TEJ9_9ACTN
MAAVVAAGGCSADEPSAAARPAVDRGSIAGVQEFGDLSRDHVENAVAYRPVPPVGGQHGPVLQNCGFYSTPVQNEYAVHSLEHGAVWITYATDLPARQVEILKTWSGSGSHVLVSPYNGLPSPVVASAWGLQLRLSGADDERLGKFVAAYAQGPQTPEPGAPCRGGAGVPR